MNIEAVVQAAVSIATPLAAAAGYLNRRRRTRAEIRENLALLEDLKKDAVIAEHTPAIGWLQGRITIDVAKVAGQSLGPRRRPIAWFSVIFSSLVLFASGAWAYWLNRETFSWYSIIPITLAVLMALAVFGNFVNREVPPEPDIPPGATPVRTDTAEERIATAINYATSGATSSMFARGGQVDVALRFVALMRSGEYEGALRLADENWNRCRIQNRLWNSYRAGELSLEEAQAGAEILIERRDQDAWEGYASLESEQFVTAWSGLDADHLGAASRRRIMAPEYDLVVLTRIPDNSGGYFVHSATQLPDSLTFLMHNVDNRWLVANHIGIAPPRPGWPPVWWSPNDPALIDDADNS